MAVHTIIPSSNVLLTDIRDTLNNAGSRATNEVISFFDSRAIINIWSFRKPYSSYLDLFKLTDSQIRSINCGLTPKQIGAYTTLPDVMDGEMNGWVYTRPSGGINSPYRVGDYVGYYADAQPMIRDFFVPSSSPNDAGVVISATAIVQQQDGKSVSLADLGSLEDAYPAVFIKQESGSQTRQYTGTSKLSSGTFNVDIPASELSVTGNWEVYPFLVLNNTYYTIPNVGKQIIKIIASSFTLSVRATKATDGTQSLDYTITVKNTGSDVTWTNNTWKLRFNGKEFTDTMTSGEMSGSLTSPQSIGGNKTTTISGTISNINNTMWGQTTMVLWVSFQSGDYIQSGVVLSMDI